MGVPAYPLRQLRRGKGTATSCLRRRAVSARPCGKLRNLQALPAHHRPHQRRQRNPRGRRFDRRAIKLVGRGARLYPNSGKPAGNVALFNDRTKDKLKKRNGAGMKRFGLLFLLVVFCGRESQAQAQKAEAPPLTVIRAGTLIDGQSETPRKNQLIFVRGQRIEKVADGSSAIPAGAKTIDLSGATVLPGMIDSHTHLFLWGEDPAKGKIQRIEKVADGSSAIPAGAKTIDLSGATVLPGMIDSHTHLFLWGEDPAKGGYDANILKAGIALRAARATYAAKRALEQGFTTLRDVETEGAGYGAIAIKQPIHEGTIPPPRLFGPPRGISTTGGYNLEGYAPQLVMPKGVQIVDRPGETPQTAREQLETGADWLKGYLTHPPAPTQQRPPTPHPTTTPH